jgi:putative redox protein
MNNYETIWKATPMPSSSPESSPCAQAVVGGSLNLPGTFSGRSGATEFPVGGPDGRGGSEAGMNPYDLLSASLAACTAMTIRLHARHKSYPLSHVEVAVSYHRAPDGGRGFFDRTIDLRGDLDEEQRNLLLRGADSCPVGRTLWLSADIRASLGEQAPEASVPAADYTKDLEEFSIVNIDPD